jgi:hypothetical protein
LELEKIQSYIRQDVNLATESGIKPKPKPNLLEQARQYAHAVVNALEKDPQLVFTSGKRQGRMMFPWSYGVVLTSIQRKDFEGHDEEANLGNVMEPHRVISQDEMAEIVEAEAFQKRLWDMFDLSGWCALSLPQIDRIR